MKPIRVIPIETERLVLRPFAVEDAEAMYNNWASDDSVTRYLTWPTHPNVEATRQCIEYWRSTNDPTWCVVLKETGEPIGSISVVSVEGESVEVGYCYQRAQWGKGLAAEALRALINCLFHTFAVDEVTAKHDVNNPNSGRVMQKSGMRFVAICEKGGQNNQGVCDVAVYALKRDAL